MVQRYHPKRAAPVASFISSLIRCTVPTPRPTSFATLMMPFPERSALRAAVFAASSILGRPRVVPFALARFRPAITRSRIIALSNSANTPIIWNMALPAGMVGAGVSHNEAEVYSESVRRGGTLVSARVPDEDASRIQAILDRFKPIDPAMRGAEYRKEGWKAFDPKAPPYRPSESEIERMRREDELV
jgi:hypothetical protein